MKRWITLVTALLLIGAAVAADKVVAKSSRHTPDWIGGMEEGYIIVSAEGITLDEAQQKAMTNVREQIVSAIATRVHYATSITLHEVTDNGSIQSHRELDSKLSVQAADIPYLANVSPSHAADYYWLKSRTREKSTYYTYHLRYPLSNSQLRLLVEEYESRQKMLNDSLQAFASTNFADYDNLDQMLIRHAHLKQFAASLHEDDSRREICAMVRSNYEQMLRKNLRVEAISSDRSKTVAGLFYGDKQLQHTLVPKTHSNCLTAIETKLTGDAATITYDYSTGCYEDGLNWLDITYTVLGKKVTTRCFIP